jgi:acylglycerol lipase
MFRILEPLIPRFFCLLVLGWLTACASPEIQPVQPVADYPELKQDQLLLGEENQLHLRQYLPEQNPKAVVIALHGFNDYSHAFALPGPYFAEHGIAFYAYDQRGFGHDKKAGIWAGRKNLVQDLQGMIRAVRKQHPHTPLYLLGESMGGAIAIHSLAQPHFPHEEVTGLILSSPAVWGGEEMSRLIRIMAWWGAHTFPRSHVTGRDLKILATDNIPLLREMGRDPLIIKKTRLDAVYGLVQLMGKAQEDASKVKLPTLLLYGRKDQVIPPGPIFAIKRKIKAPVRFVVYPEGYHMLLRDQQRERVWKDMLAWIENPAAPLPSGAEFITAEQTREINNLLKNLRPRHRKTHPW